MYYSTKAALSGFRTSSARANQSCCDIGSRHLVDLEMRIFVALPHDRYEPEADVKTSITYATAANGCFEPTVAICSMPC